MQTFTLGEMIQFHHALLLLKRPSQKMKIAISRLEEEICHVITSIKRIGPSE